MRCAQGSRGIASRPPERSGARTRREEPSPFMGGSHLDGVLNEIYRTFSKIVVKTPLTEYRCGNVWKHGLTSVYDTVQGPCPPCTHRRRQRGCSEFPRDDSPVERARDCIRVH